MTTRSLPAIPSAQWIDEDGDGRYDALVVETRGLKNPRTYDATGIPFHADGKTVIQEKISLDKADANILYDDITVTDNALTRPWSARKIYRRVAAKAPIWWREEICAENNVHVVIGKEDYFLSADGLLMPTKKNQAAPGPALFQRESSRGAVHRLRPDANHGAGHGRGGGRSAS